MDIMPDITIKYLTCLIVCGAMCLVVAGIFIGWLLWS
jgi:hypothetical protein